MATFKISIGKRTQGIGKVKTRFAENTQKGLYRIRPRPLDKDIWILIIRITIRSIGDSRLPLFIAKKIQLARIEYSSNTKKRREGYPDRFRDITKQVQTMKSYCLKSQLGPISISYSLTNGEDFMGFPP